MYYLAREKLERDRVYGPGRFASSQLSVNGDTANTTSASMTTPLEDRSSHSNSSQQYANSNQPHYSAPGTVPSRKEPVPSTKARADYSMPLPRLPAPETSHYSGMSYDTSTPTASPTAGAFAVPQMPTPRARDLGAGLTSVSPSPTLVNTAATSTTPGTSPTQAIPVRQHVEIDQNATVGPKRGALPRAPPPSTHRRSHSMSQRPTMLTTRWGGMFGGGHPAVDENGKVIPEPPRTAGSDMSNFSTSPVTDDKDKNHDFASPFSGGATLVRKFGSLLVGSGDGSRRHAPAKRGTILGLAAPTGTDDEKAAGVPTPSEKERRKDDEPSSDATPRQTPPPINAIIHTTPPSPTAPSIASSVPTRKSFVPQQLTNAHRRAATLLDPQGRAMRHERRSSTGGVAIMGNSVSSGNTSISGGTIGRTRRPSTGYSTSGKPFSERLFGPKTSEPASTHGGENEMAEKKEEDYADGALEGETTDREEDDKAAVKPVFLKGLFRYILIVWFESFLILP